MQTYVQQVKEYLSSKSLMKYNTLPFIFFNASFEKTFKSDCYHVSA